jgi:hypothetical protein
VVELTTPAGKIATMTAAESLLRIDILDPGV